MSTCKNNMDMSIAAHLMGGLPPCCRTAFAVAVLTGMAEDIMNSGNAEQFAAFGFKPGDSEVQTAINFLQTVVNVNKTAKIEVEL